MFSWLNATSIGAFNFGCSLKEMFFGFPGILITAIYLIELSFCFISLWFLYVFVLHIFVNLSFSYEEPF